MNDTNLATTRMDRPPLVMPVTRMVSRPAVAIVNGQLVAVKVLVDGKRRLPTGTR